MFSVSYLSRIHQPSLAPRYFAVGYVALLLVAGLYPFRDWFDSGIPTWAFLGFPWPFYFTWFDFCLNILAFLPLGIALYMDFHRKKPGWLAWLLAGLLCFALSFSIETVQVYVPNRVASNVDLFANTLGGFLGGILPGLLAKLPFSQAIRRWRHVAFADGALADFGVALLIIWFIAQMNPAQPLFGIVVEPGGLPEPFVSPLDNPALFLRLLEIGGAILHFVSVGILLATLLRPHRYFMRWMALLVLFALTLKLLMAGMLLRRDEFYSWLNVNVLEAQLIGWLLLGVIYRLRRWAQVVLGILALICTEIIAYLWPLTDNPAAIFQLFRHTIGHVRNFNAVANLAADMWPLGMAIYFVWYLIWRAKQD